MLFRKVVVSPICLTERLTCSILIMPTFCMLWIDGVVAWCLIGVSTSSQTVRNSEQHLPEN